MRSSTLSAEKASHGDIAAGAGFARFAALVIGSAGVVYGDISEELSELAAWMSWHEIKPLRYRDAMQRPDRS